MNIAEIKRKAVPVLQKHHILRAGVFGSYATNKVTKKSDLDLLVELGTKISLLDFIGIKLELEETLGVPVDLVEYKAIKPLLKERILKQEVSIL
jgi:predicted nucleotidyltransferase